MSTTIDYTSTDVTTINELEELLASELSAEELATIMASIDGTQDLDDSFFDSEIVQTYLKLTQLKLWALIDPTNYQTAMGLVGPLDWTNIDEVFDTLYPYMSDSLKETLEKVVYDSADILSLGASEMGEEEVENLYALLEAAMEETETNSDSTYTWNQDLLETLGVNDSLLEMTAESLDNAGSGMAWALEQIAAYDEFYADLIADINEGVITIEEADWQMSEVLMTKEMLYGYVQNFQEQMTIAAEFAGAILKAENDHKDQLARNLKTA